MKPKIEETPTLLEPVTDAEYALFLASPDVLSKLLAKDENSEQDAISVKFRMSVRAHGVIFPVMVVGQAEDPSSWQIADGRRRARTAIEFGLKCPVIVINREGAEAALTLIGNQSRSNSPIIEYLRVKQMLPDAKGSADLLAKRLRLNVGAIRGYAQMTQLSSDLEEVFIAGAMAKGTAIAASRLTRRQQESLVIVWKETQGRSGRLTSAMVKSVVGAEPVSATGELPGMGPSEEPGPAVEPSAEATMAVPATVVRQAEPTDPEPEFDEFDPFKEEK